MRTITPGRSGNRALHAFFSTILLLLLLALNSCGGASPTVPPPAGNFSNASLKGQYAFRLSGVDSKGAYFARIGSFTADGAGNITAGVEDVLNLSTAQPASVIPFTGGGYSVQPNGRGQILLKIAGGTVQLAMDMQSASTGFIIETDLTAATSGSFHLQTPADFSVSALSGQYVFDLFGVSFQPSTAAPISLIGEFAANAAGTITGGLIDTNNGNVQPPAATPISPGSYAMDSSGNAAFGRGTAVFNGYTLTFYIVDSTHLILLEEDALGGSSGDANLQSAGLPAQASQFTGSFVFLLNGFSTGGLQGPVARVARFTSDGNGGLGAISLDDNNNGRYTHISQGSNISKAAYAIDTGNSGSGRGTFTFSDSGAGTFTFVFYMLSASQAVVQNTTLGTIADGPMLAQSAGPFALGGLTGNFVFSWSGVQLGVNQAIPFAEDYVGQYALSTATTSNISGVTDFAQLGLSGSTPGTSVPLGGTLTVNGDGTANNLYKFAVNGSSSTTLNFQAYFVNASTVFMITSDNTRTTVGLIAQQ